MRVELDRARAAATSDAAQHSAAIELLEAELAVQREYTAAYDRQIELGEVQAKAIDELRTRCSEQTQHIAQLSAKASDVERRADALQRELASSRTTTSELGAQRDKLSEQLRNALQRASEAEQRAIDLGTDCADAAMRLQVLV